MEGTEPENIEDKRTKRPEQTKVVALNIGSKTTTLASPIRHYLHSKPAQIRRARKVKLELLRFNLLIYNWCLSDFGDSNRTVL